VIDFWNNPILVSTVRSRLRGGYLLHVLALYPVLLLMAGATVPLVYPKLLVDWPYYGFIALLVLQFAGSGLVATASASHSLKAEVVNQTLDFLRLTPLSPAQILVGKMLGETSLAFFAAVASFPVAVVCWAVGGVDIVTLILLYINLLLYVLLCGAAGLTMRLEVRDDKRVDSVSMLALSGWMSAIPILSTLSLDLPHRVVALTLLPIVMLVLTFFVLHVMIRTLESPFNPPVSKAVAYVLLLAFDAAAAAAIAWFLPAGVGPKLVAFWSAHLLASTYMISGVTPWREALRTWAWRYRGRVPFWRDAWFGDRSPNRLTVFVDVAIGLFTYAAVFLPILYAVEGEKELRANVEGLWGAPLLSSVLVWAYGAVFQWNSLIFGRSGNGIVALFIACLVAPYYIGLIEDVEWITHVSPIPHFTQWFAERPGKVEMLLVPLGLLVALELLAESSFAARMRYLGRVVDRKLHTMGVTR
jgi:ABC-type multidrug transport system permease subunit